MSIAIAQKTLASSLMHIKEYQKSGNRDGDENINTEFYRIYLAPQDMQLGESCIAHIKIKQVFEEIADVRSNQEYPDVHLNNAGGQGYRKRRDEWHDPEKKHYATVFPVVTGKAFADALDFLVPNTEIFRQRSDEDIFQFVADKIVQPQPQRLAEVADQCERNEVCERASINEGERSSRPHNERRRDRTDDFFEKRADEHEPLERYLRRIRPNKLFDSSEKIHNTHIVSNSPSIAEKKQFRNGRTVIFSRFFVVQRNKSNLLSLLSDSQALSATGKSSPQSTTGHSSFFQTESTSSNRESNRQKILLFVRLAALRKNLITSNR